MARFPGAVWRGPIPNQTDGGMWRPILGLVLHIEQGSEAGTDSWFHNAAAQASAHFGNPKAGPLDQWVDTDDKAWAQAAGNPRWVSVETEGYAGEALTASQLENVAQLLAWLHATEGVPLQVTDSVNTPGLGWHGMGGQAWGGHLGCPGDPIKAQRQQIVDRARQIARQEAVSPMYSPALALQPIVADLACPSGGAWLLAADGSVYAFGGAPFKGGANGHSYFAGRTPARLELPVAGRDPAGSTYIVVATSGERYAY